MTGNAVPASIISPVPGQLSSGQNTFTWNSGMGGTQYTLAAGSSPGGTNYYSANLGTAQSAVVNIPSGASAAYVTLQTLTPASWLTQSYEYAIPTVPTGTTVSLGTISIQPNAAPVTVPSPLPNDTIIACSAPVGVMSLIAGSPGNQPVTFSASSVAQLGTTAIACSTLASNTLTGDMDLEEINYLAGSVTTTQVGFGVYQVSIAGWFGDQGGDVYVSGNQNPVLTNLQYTQTDIEFVLTENDGVCGSTAVEIQPNDFDPSDDGTPEDLDADLYLCPDVAAPTYSIQGTVVSASGKPIQGITIAAETNGSGAFFSSTTQADGTYSIPGHALHPLERGIWNCKRRFCSAGILPTPTCFTIRPLMTPSSRLLWR